MNSVPPPCNPDTADVFLLFSKTKYLRISLSSAIISDARLIKPWFVKPSNHFLKIRWKGSSKQIVMVFLMVCLFLPTTIMESALSNAPLQVVSDLIIILWGALIWLTIYKRRKRVCFFISKYNSSWQSSV